MLEFTASNWQVKIGLGKIEGFMILFNRRGFFLEIRMMGDFVRAQGSFIANVGVKFLGWIGVVKETSTRLMYRQRGRFSQSFINGSMAVLSFLAIVFSGKLEELISERQNSESLGSSYLLLAADGVGGADTKISLGNKGEVTEYRVEEGDTVASIAQKFGVNIDTIVWENGLKSADAIKPKQILRILPVVGVKHKVKRGETVYSIAKSHQIDAQAIIDYPFNSFVNDETFALAAGQELIIPDGIKPKETASDVSRYTARQVAPAVPGVVGEGSYMWPTSGRISQRYYWYHQAVDIASKESPAILASQRGTVVAAGWNGGGYGNYVVVDHGNGYSTLYAHMANNSIVVKAGQVVSQGQRLGTMGSTGRSTGPHLHFEIKGPNGNSDPLTLLK